MNVKTIRNIPVNINMEKIPQEFVMRGEILMTRSVFDRLNEERAAESIQLFANPRNAAAGTLKLLDPKIVASRSLDCFFYFILLFKCCYILFRQYHLLWQVVKYFFRRVF